MIVQLTNIVKLTIIVKLECYENSDTNARTQVRMNIFNVFVKKYLR